MSWIDHNRRPQLLAMGTDSERVMQEQKEQEQVRVCRPVSQKLPFNLLFAAVKEGGLYQAGVSRAQKLQEPAQSSVRAVHRDELWDVSATEQVPCVRVCLERVSSAADAASLCAQLVSVQAEREQIRALMVHTSAQVRPLVCSASGARVCRQLLDEVHWPRLQCLELRIDADAFPAVSAPELQELNVHGDLTEQDAARLRRVLRESARLREVTLESRACVSALPEQNESVESLVLRSDPDDARFSSWLKADAYPLRVRGFSSLQELDLFDVDRLTRVLGSDLPAGLRSLSVAGCNELSEIDVRGAWALQSLDVSQCPRVTHVRNLSLLSEQLSFLKLYFSPVHVHETDVQGLKLRMFMVSCVAFMSVGALQALQVSRLDHVRIPFCMESAAAKFFMVRMRENGRSTHVDFDGQRYRHHALGGVRLVQTELEPGTAEDDALIGGLDALDASASAEDEEQQQYEHAGGDVVDLTHASSDDEREQHDGSARGRRVRRRVRSASDDEQEHEESEVVIR